jgi:hypothetical protein
MKPGMSWSAIFPRLHQNTDAVWNALAWMESAGVTVAFHGHTHVQMVWVWELATNHLRSYTNVARARLAPGHAHDRWRRQRGRAGGWPLAALRDLR